MKSESTLPDGLVRLEKHVAHLNLASRREAKQLILDGKISVNGSIVYETGFGIHPDKDHVALVGVRANKKTVALYKPRGIETTKTDPVHEDIHDMFPQFQELAPIGRLDKDSEGLILLSNDGLVARSITGEHSSIEKEYRVTVRESVTEDALAKMRSGIFLGDKKTLPTRAEKIDEHTFSIILIEGRKHQIRRMADACRLTIENLKRIRVGVVTLGELSVGDFRDLSPEEVVWFLNQ